MTYLAGFDPISITIAIALSVGLSALSKALSKPKKKRSTFDNEPTPLAERGAMVPIVVGRRRISAHFLWAGDRILRRRRGIYYESSWHGLCVGPATRLNSIVQGGKTIWEGPIDSATTPSGTEFDLDNDEGTFKIYWGECDQPVEPDLEDASRVGWGSRWPHLCYVWWKPKLLGGAPLWPIMEYDIEVDLEASPLTQSAMKLSRGVNPAHVAWFLLTAKHPHGCGIDSALLDEESFEALGELAEAEDIGVNMIVGDDNDADQAIADLMADYGFFIVQRQDKLVAVPVRAVSGPMPTLDDDLVRTLDVEQEKDLSPLLPDRLTFIIKDRDQNFRNSDIHVHNDGLATQYGNPKLRKMELPTVTDQDTGFIIGKRRHLQEATAPIGFVFEAQRDARLLLPGSPFNVSGIGQMRAVTVQPQWDGSYATRLEAVFDQYSQLLSGDPHTPNEAPTPPVLPPLQDVFVRVLEAPPTWSTVPALAVFRVRAHTQIIGAEVWISANGGSTYTHIGDQDIAAAGGRLNSFIIPPDPAIIEHGPSIAPYNTDVDRLLDLNASLPDWYAGIQVGVVNDEIFYLRRCIPRPGGYQLVGIIRARDGTVNGWHRTNDKVVIAELVDIAMLRSPLITSGMTLFVKTRPRTRSRFVDLSDVTPVQVNIP